VLTTFTDVFGLSVYATETIKSGTAVVSCPFSYVISPSSARTHLGLELGGEFKSDHAVIVVYLALHRWKGPLPSSVVLDHHDYVATLPEESQLRTPLWFSEQEMRLLQGTNLYGATIDRRDEWHSEWLCVAARLSALSPSIDLPWFVFTHPPPLVLPC
jgi:hypothetical protein